MAERPGSTAMRPDTVGSDGRVEHQHTDLTTHDEAASTSTSTSGRHRDEV